MKKLCLCLILMLLLCSCAANNTVPAEPSVSAEVSTIDSAVTKFLLESNKGGYLSGECSGEGHLVLGTEEKNGEVLAYLLTMYGEYGFTNDKFIKVSGSGVIPAVMTLDKTGNGYVGKSIKYPDDGANYTKSIKEMFPLEYHLRVLTIADNYRDELEAQEQVYAKAYLKEIGRDVEICEYGDLNVKILTSYGVPVETSNMLIGYEGLENYPLFVGKEEKLEDGVRFVYEVSVDEETKEITYKKYPYGSHSDIKEKIVFDKNGNKIEEQR